MANEDKHFVIALVLGFLLALKCPKVWLAGLFALGCISFAVFEIWQAHTGTGVFEVSDIIAGVVGFGLGITLAIHFGVKEVKS